MLPKIPEMLIQFRSFKYAWNTDISKMYNQLHLRPEALPYSLFLFHESLDDSVPPDIWIMTRAWYGVSSTGNQAGIALERLAEESADTLPAALFPLTKGRYVDDGLSGADTTDERQTQECLATGGFTGYRRWKNHELLRLKKRKQI
jgi:hypothetical protein